ncbi:unnamed protein product [Fusarium graminearum]|nr:unnamed protein product [Fusarium graminearum]VTO82241.1 unnamed protein product [Fusarium graminearum]
MAIHYLILLSRQGKVRLAKWFSTLSPKDKAKIVKDVSQLVLARRTRMCNFLEYKDTKIVYRRYASLFFIAGCSSDDNELITLEIIHRYVEQMDKYYGNVCELDIIFSFTKAYYILDEILLAGELQETSKKNILRCIGQQDSLEDMEQYLPVQDFEAVTSTLNFNTPDCNVTGGCDLYTTKASGSDKKLYKNIDNDLNSQHEALLKLGASLSPPERAHMLATSPSMQMFSHSSAFGPLSELSSRKTFAYLIATLNASHPHYDFSHVLRPNDFKRERNLRRVMINLDSILQNVRPNFEPKSLGSSLGSEATSSIWGPQCWSLIDKEMHLNECTIFSYNPDSDPFEEDESAIWASHYFFFNRALKRVAYLYVRVVPVISSHSPTLRPANLARNHNQQLESAGAQKRANYWLGENAELVPYNEGDEYLDDGLFWNRGENGDLVAYSDDEFEDDIDDMDMNMLDRSFDRSSDRFMSEDIAGRMEI